jgi:hypothetical protein
LWEHKAVILQLLEFMEANGHLDLSVRASEQFAQIQAQVAQLRLLMLRCAMDLSHRRLTRSIPRIREIALRERELLRSILAAAFKSSHNKPGGTGHETIRWELPL